MMWNIKATSIAKQGRPVFRYSTWYGFYVPLIAVFIWAAIALFADFLSLQPNEIQLDRMLTVSDNNAWFGYDDLGRPIMDRVLVGAQTSFVVAVSVVAISAMIGVLVGVLSAYYGSWVDTLVVFIIDVFLAFPGILLAIALAGIMGPGIDNVVIALCIVGWVGFARLTRAQVFSVKERDHILAAKALGSSTLVIVVKHILPLIVAPLIIEASFGIAGVVIAEAGISFIGLGVQPPQASWGSMIRDGARYLLVAPHMVLIPGVVLAIVVLSVNMLGDRLRDMLDVKETLNSSK